MIATWIAGTVAPGDDTAIVAIFAILALAAALGELSYFYRAACTTAALAFLYAFFGQTGGNLLADRLAGVLAGSVIGVATAWFVLPVRTSDVVQLRIGALLAVAAETMHSIGGGQSRDAALDQLTARDHELAALTPTLRAGRRFGLKSAGRLDRSVTHARALASRTEVLANGPLGRKAHESTGAAELSDLGQEITLARLSLRESSN